MAVADLSRHVEAFLEMMAVERGASKHTLAAYGRDLADVDAVLRGQGADLDAAAASDLKSYLATLAKDGAASRTAARRLSCLRQFYKFLFAEGVRSDDPSAGLDSPRQGRSLPKFLSCRAAQSARPRCSNCSMPRACGFRNSCRSRSLRCVQDTWP